MTTLQLTPENLNHTGKARLAAKGKMSPECFDVPFERFCNSDRVVFTDPAGEIHIFKDSYPSKTPLQSTTMGQPEKQFSDTERLTWLSKNLTVNMGLAPGGYWQRSDLRWQQEKIREAIDNAMRDAGEKQPPVRFGPECDQALDALYAKFGNNQTTEQKLHIHSLISGEMVLHMEEGEAHDEVKLAIVEHAWLCAKGLAELELV